MATNALEGAKVLEFAEFVSGPFCAKLLADLGAEVIKVERPLVGDSARRKGPFPQDIPHSERSGLFLYLNTNKKGISLDVGTALGKRIFLKLVQWADILIEDHLPQEMEEMGLTYGALREVNPRLVMTSITPYGQTGPYANYRAYNLNTFHAGGEGYTTPSGSVDVDREPLKAGGYLADYDCGFSAGVATLAARLAQVTMGIGQHVDVSKQEAMMAIQRVELSNYPNDGQYSTRGMRTGPIGGLLPCKDGYVMVTAAENHQWLALMDFLGNPEWSQAQHWKDEMYRSRHAAEIQPKLEEAIRQYTKEEIYHGAQAKGCPIGIVYDAEDIFNSTQLRAREFFCEVEHPEVGRLKYPTVPYIFSKTPAEIKSPAPLLGQHNEAVLCDLLGYSRQDLVKMRQAGIV